MTPIPIYSASEVLTIIAAVGVLVGILGAQTVNIIIALKHGKTLTEMKSATDVIGVHVNGAAAAAQATIVALQDKVQMLLELLAQKKQDAALLAQTAATLAAVATPVVKPEIPT